MDINKLRHCIQKIYEKKIIDNNLSCWTIPESAKGDGIIFETNSRRPQVQFRDPMYASLLNRNSLVKLYCSWVVVFFNPYKCTFLIDGSHCTHLHQTVFDVCTHHLDTEGSRLFPSSLDISHLCHNRICLNPEHLVIELSTSNCIRNSCRTDCLCGLYPSCIIARNDN